MKSYEDIEEEFEAVRAQFAIDCPKPVKKYIAYSNGEVLKTASIGDARQFSPRGLIETIDPDPKAVREWRQGCDDIRNRITRTWKEGLYAETTLPSVICEKIMNYAYDHSDSYDERSDMFVGLASLVEDVLRDTSK